MKLSLSYVFAVISVFALLPSWAFAAVLWRRSHGQWVWVSPIEYTKCVLSADDWVLCVTNCVLWICIGSIDCVINLAITYFHLF